MTGGQAVRGGLVVGIILVAAIGIVAFVVWMASAAVGGSTVDLDGTTWRLVAIDGEAVPDGIEATAEFAEGQISGKGGCNSFGGDYEIDGDTLRFGPIFSTMMYCDEASMVVEGTFLRALHDARISITGGELVLTSPEGTVLTFTARQP